VSLSTEEALAIVTHRYLTPGAYPMIPGLSQVAS
jgi:hypothetical protein